MKPHLVEVDSVTTDPDTWDLSINSAIYDEEAPEESPLYVVQAIAEYGSGNISEVKIVGWYKPNELKMSPVDLEAAPELVAWVKADKFLKQYAERRWDELLQEQQEFQILRSKGIYELP